MSEVLSPDNLLEVRGLTVTFEAKGRETTILEDIHFSLARNKTLGIVGESGSGKTMTIQSILQLIPMPPLKRMAGEILFQGQNLLALNSREMRKIRGSRIAYIFQEPMSALNPVLTIGEQIREMILAHQRVNRKQADELALELLNEVGIPAPGQRIKSFPHEISGGMRQRAMIAMALSCNPDMLLADEPTTALDVTIQAQVLELFSYLVESRGMSIVFVTHDLGVIAEIADDILVLNQGRVIEYNTIESVFSHPAHPYTKDLLEHARGVAND